ncbi:MAG: DUF1641 domain-containing protein [Myxococcales bacterium]|nr:DUF1641 domain-containing protein [Myxococcales bacterium]
MERTNSPRSTPSGSLAALEARLERIERLLEPLAALADAAMPGSATLVDTFDDWAGRDGRVDGRVRGLGQLLLQLSEPRTLERLTTLLEQANALPAMIATAVDSADDAVARAAHDGVQLERVVVNVRKLVHAMMRGVGDADFDAEALAPAFAPRTLGALGRLSQAVVDARALSRPTGFLGLLRSTSDAHVQRALGLLLAVARELGRSLEEAEHKKLAEDNDG